jgi:hypothetical protein
VPARADPRVLYPVFRLQDPRTKAAHPRHRPPYKLNINLPCQLLRAAVFGSGDLRRQLNEECHIACVIYLGGQRERKIVVVPYCEHAAVLPVQVVRIDPSNGRMRVVPAIRLCVVIKKGVETSPHPLLNQSLYSVTPKRRAGDNGRSAVVSHCHDEIVGKPRHLPFHLTTKWKLALWNPVRPREEAVPPHCHGEVIGGVADDNESWCPSGLPWLNSHKASLTGWPGRIPAVASCT